MILREMVRVQVTIVMGLTAVVFPGQGSQSVGMGRDLFSAVPRSRSVFERANDVLGFDLARVCFEGPVSELEKTDLQQPAIFVVSVAIWEALLEANGGAFAFDRTAGLSLGEYTALYAAGAFSFEEGLRLVRRRGELMQKAALATPSAMASVIGGDEAAVLALCEKARGVDVLAPANFNCPGQVVIAGHRVACDRAVAAAGEFGVRVVPLAVAGAFHTPIMDPAAYGLREMLDQTTVSDVSVPVVSNVDAEYHRGPADTRERLRRQLTHPVLWQRCVERLIGEGVDRFVEVGPGRVLTGLLKKIDRTKTGVNLSSMEALSGAITAR